MKSLHPKRLKVVVVGVCVVCVVIYMGVHGGSLHEGPRFPIPPLVSHYTHYSGIGGL